MSLPVTVNVQCANCGHTNEFMDWASTNSFGSPDLDTRPAEDYRFSMNQMLVKKCEECGYCNADIEQISENMRDVITSNLYREQLNNKEFTEKANEFLCKSILLESINEIEQSAWASLHAAWNCDDSDKYVQSKYCRKNAIRLFQLANTIAPLNFEKQGEYPALLIDLLRKTEQFEEAHKICNLRLEKEDDEIIRKVLFYQNQLIDVKDVKTYTIENAIEYYDNNIIEDSDNEESFDDKDYEEDDGYYEPDYQENDWKRDYFDAMTDGQLGDYDDFNGDIDDIDTWARG